MFFFSFHLAPARLSKISVEIRSMQQKSHTSLIAVELQFDHIEDFVVYILLADNLFSCTYA